MPPPAATPPSTAATSPFNFDRYGVRVPCVLVSPYIKPGTILRPPDVVPLDHTSIIATLRKRFNLGDQLTNRDAVAPDVESVLQLDNPDNLGPGPVVAHHYVPSPADVGEARRRPLNGMQRALLAASTRLPLSDVGLDERARALKAKMDDMVKAADTAVEDAAHAAKARLYRFFANA